MFHQLTADRRSRSRRQISATATVAMGVTRATAQSPATVKTAPLVLLVSCGALLAQLVLVPTPVLAQATNPAPRVIPSLRNWTGATGTFTISGTSRIVIDSSVTTTSTTLHGITTDITYTAQNFQEQLHMVTGLSLPIVTQATTSDGDILLSLLDTLDATLGDEGYKMTIGATVEIEANTNNGITYARQTILQVLKQSDNLRDLPHGTATDYPASQHRSFMLDMGRKYWQMDFLEDTIIRLGWQKINLFHLHISETDFFRLDSPNFPGLGAAGASYTRAEIDRLHRLAKKHNVILVPEIDMPGHAAAITRYYEDTYNPGGSIRFPLTPPSCLRMDQSPFGGGSHWNINYADEVSRQFARDLLSEFAPWFESRYFHIGADETSYNSACPVLVTYADLHTAGNEGNVLPHFINSMKDHLAGLGKETHIWNGYEHNASRHYLSKDVVVYFWTGSAGQLRSLLNDGYTAVYTPISGSYALYLTPGNSNFPGAAAILRATLQTDTLLRGHGYQVWADGRTTTYDEFFELQAVSSRAVFAERMWGGSGSRSTDFAEFVDKLDAIGGAIGVTPVSSHSGIPKDRWSTESVSSAKPRDPGDRVFDRNIATAWITSGGTYPHEIVIDLDQTYNITRVEFLPRLRGVGNRGRLRPPDRIGAYEVYVSTDTSAWGTAVATGTVVGDNTTDSMLETIDLASPKVGRYVRLRSTSPMIAGETDASIVEINVHGVIGLEIPDPPPPVPEPLHWWKVDEGTGTTLADSGSAAAKRHGTISGASWTTRFPEVNALDFDGTNDYVSLSADNNASLSGNWTAAMWVKRNANVNSASILGGGEWSLKIQQWGDTSQQRVGITRHGSGGRDDTMEYSAPLNEWVHLTFVRNGSETTLYVNGAFETSTSQAIDLPLARIGERPAGRLDDANMGLSDLRVYNVALSANQVEDVASAGPGERAGQVAFVPHSCPGP